MRSNRSKRISRATVAVAALIAFGVAITTQLAGAAAAPAAPTVSTTVTNPTASTSASFTYTDVTAGVSFLCSLDKAAYASCPTAGVTYSGLAEGTHTFSAEATDGKKTSSPSATATWTIDRTGPVVTPTVPVAGGLYKPADLRCAGSTASPSLCGTASDSPAGVASVQGALQRQGAGWLTSSGTFTGSSPTFFNAAGTTSWRVDVPATLTDGSYTASIKATDSLGSATTLSVPFTIDATKPVAAITAGPLNPSADPKATFTATSTETSAFLCGLDLTDTTKFTSCGTVGTRTTIVLQKLAVGTHCLNVVAVDGVGNQSDLASVPPDKQADGNGKSGWCWEQAATSGFAITGSVQGLAPGVTKPVDLQISNPFNQTIYVSGISGAVSTSPASGACSAADFSVTPMPSTLKLAIPAGQTKSLTSLGLPSTQWPQVTMLDTPSNQNACKGVALTLTWTGMATK